jgi:cytidylate kinase
VRGRKNIIIAIDGPAGSGKSTSARLVAERLGYTYLDTGAMYRAITLAAIENGCLEDTVTLRKLLPKLKISVQQTLYGQKTVLNKRDVSDRIRLADVTTNVSRISAIDFVREKLVQLQQDLGKNGGVVVDGRDIGTVVFPDAELKIFLTASIEARSRRRLAETEGANNTMTVDQLAEQLQARDDQDSTRSVAPLIKATDAIEIDTSNISIKEQVGLIVDRAKKVISELTL